MHLMGELLRLRRLDPQSTPSLSVSRKKRWTRSPPAYAVELVGPVQASACHHPFVKRIQPMKVAIFSVLLFSAIAAPASSAYLTRLNDPAAVYLISADFPVRGNGIADDSAPLQAAINKVQENTGG